jgi:hypothetical protein
MAKNKLSVPHQEIFDWFKKEPDFDSGYALFAKYSRNRALMSYLQRKRDLSKLTYELEKLMLFPITDRVGQKYTAPVITAVVNDKTPVVEIPAGEKTTQPTFLSKFMSSIDKWLSQDPEVKSETIIIPTAETTTAMDTDSPDFEAHQQLKIIKDGKVEYNDLPDDLKIVYDQIVEDYKQMRTLHEKMKLSTTDEDRLPFRTQLEILDDQIAAGWLKIDQALEVQAAPVDETKPAVELDPMELGKAIMAARSFISRFLPGYAQLDEKAKPLMLVKLQDRVKCLADNNAKVKPETLAELRKNGIIDDTTTLTAQ